VRRLLLRVLLIAVFLNAAVGVPLHAAVHLAAPEAAHSTSAPEDGDSHENIQSGCAWCLAQAEASGAPPAVPDAPWTAHAHLSHVQPTTTTRDGFSVGLWCSSPRGPPR
jgi:hypothetical protein